MAIGATVALLQAPCLGRETWQHRKSLSRVGRRAHELLGTFRVTSQGESWYQNGLPRSKLKLRKAAAPINGWEYPLLTVIYPGFDCGSGTLLVLHPDTCEEMLFHQATTCVTRNNREYSHFLRTSILLPLQHAWDDAFRSSFPCKCFPCRCVSFPSMPFNFNLFSFTNKTTYISFLVARIIHTPLYSFPSVQLHSVPISFFQFLSIHALLSFQDSIHCVPLHSNHSSERNSRRAYTVNSSRMVL